MADFPPALDHSRFGGQGTANHSFTVGDGRLELPTSCMSSKHSNQLS